MKRVLAMLLIVLMLTGCSKTEPAPEKPVEKEPAPVEQVQPAPAPPPAPEAKPEPAPAPEPIPEPEPVPEPEPEPTPAPEPEVTPEQEVPPELILVPETDWGAFVNETYASIVDQEEFRALVWLEDDSRTDLIIRKGVNNWNVEHTKYMLNTFQWEAVPSGDWISLTQTAGYGPELCFWGGDVYRSFTCCAGGDIACVTVGRDVFYLRALGLPEGETLYSTLLMVAEDAISHEIGYVTVDGSLTPQEAAQAIAEKRAENHMNAPDWVAWKVSDARAGKTEVYDIYYGEPQEFCCNLTIEVYFDDPAAANHVRWQAGAGLEEADEEGYWRHFNQLLVRKNADGNWAVIGGGTGGYSVSPEWPAEKPWLDWLVELFCLTEGTTHDWIAPCQILALPPDQMALLPAILDQLTEAESSELCSIMGEILRGDEYNYYTIDTLKPLLGDYGDLLDA